MFKGIVELKNIPLTKDVLNEFDPRIFSIESKNWFFDRDTSSTDNINNENEKISILSTPLSIILPLCAGPAIAAQFSDNVRFNIIKRNNDKTNSNFNFNFKAFTLSSPFFQNINICEENSRNAKKMKNILNQLSPYWIQAWSTRWNGKWLVECSKTLTNNYRDKKINFILDDYYSNNLKTCITNCPTDALTSASFLLTGVCRFPEKDKTYCPMVGSPLINQFPASAFQCMIAQPSDKIKICPTYLDQEEMIFYQADGFYQQTLDLNLSTKDDPNSNLNLQKANIILMKKFITDYGPLSVKLLINKHKFSSASDNFKDDPNFVYLDFPKEDTYEHPDVTCVNFIGWGSNYWIVRNFLGTNWANKGYFLLDFNYPLIDFSIFLFNPENDMKHFLVSPPTQNETDENNCKCRFGERWNVKSNSCTTANDNNKIAGTMMVKQMKDNYNLQIKKSNKSMIIMMILIFILISILLIFDTDLILFLKNDKIKKNKMKMQSFCQFELIK